MDQLILLHIKFPQTLQIANLVGNPRKEPSKSVSPSLSTLSAKLIIHATYLNLGIICAKLFDAKKILLI